MVSKNIKIGITIVLILNFVVLLYSVPRKLKNKEKSVNLNLQSLKLNGDMESGEYGFKKSAVQPEKEQKSVCGFVNHKEEKIYFGVDHLKISVYEASSDYSCRKTCCEAPNVSVKEKYHSPNIYYVVNEQMTEKQINELLKNGESEKAEFKKSTAQLEKGLKAVCAFLNHKGGSVYFGIYEDKVVGQEVSDSTLKSISQKIRQNIKPEISPEIKVLETEGKKIIEVEVKEGKNKLYYLDGIAYKRVGTENLMISPEELERIILERRKNHWDEQICSDVDFEDMDENKMRWFLKEGIRQKRMNIPKDTSTDDMLMRVNLLKDRRLTNAAVLLFSKEPKFIQSGVKCIVLPTTEFVKPYTSYQSYEGTLFDQIDKSLVFVLENIHRPLWLEPGKASAKNPYEIPEDAVRECIVNAVVHRDYESASKVQVRIFPDRVEIWNPGFLPGQLKPDDLKKPHPSIPRNSLIFRQLYRAGYVEDAGGGTTDVILLCRDSGLPEPKFEEKMGCFVVTIWRNKYADTYLDRFNLNERQRKAIDIIKENKKITNKEYQSIFQVSRNTSSNDLRELVNNGIVKETGTGKRDLVYTLE